VSDLDDSIRRAVHEQLDRLEIPTAGRAAVVRSSLRPPRRAPLLAVAMSVALVVCAVAIGVAIHSGHESRVVKAPGHGLRIVRTLTATSLGLAHPQAVAIGPNGHLYITDSRHQTITEATRGGRVVRSWGGPGTRAGRFRLANGGIVVDPQGQVYVVDSGNGRVQVFTSTGHFVRQLGAYGTGPGQFLFPTSIALARDGSVYVSDDRRTTLTKLSPTGRQEWRIGEQHTPPDLVGHTHFGSTDSHGRLVVANDDTGRVVYLSPQGREVDAFGTGASGDHENSLGHPPAADFPQGACDTTVDSTDHVYVAGCIPQPKTGSLVQTYDASHRLVGAWPHSPLATAPRFDPDGLAVSVGFGSILELLADH
jgi:sugar lactone lactonase YvrE